MDNCISVDKQANILFIVDDSFETLLNGLSRVLDLLKKDKNIQSSLEGNIENWEGRKELVEKMREDHSQNGLNPLLKERVFSKKINDHDTIYFDFLLYKLNACSDFFLEEISEMLKTLSGLIDKLSTALSGAEKDEPGWGELSDLLSHLGNLKNDPAWEEASGLFSHLKLDEPVWLRQYSEWKAELKKYNKDFSAMLKQAIQNKGKEIKTLKASEPEQAMRNKEKEIKTLQAELDQTIRHKGKEIKTPQTKLKQAIQKKRKEIKTFKENNRISSGVEKEQKLLLAIKLKIKEIKNQLEQLEQGFKKQAVSSQVQEFGRGVRMIYTKSEIVSRLHSNALTVLDKESVNNFGSKAREEYTEKYHVFNEKLKFLYEPPSDDVRHALTRHRP